MYKSHPEFDFESIAYGFFGSQGGVSEGLYQSLNVDNRRDDIACVTENRKRVCKALLLNDDMLLTLHQSHSKRCRTVSNHDDVARSMDSDADAMVTDVPGVALGILTADCAPVLFYGQKDDGSPVIGAAHAGWRGALDGVLEKTVSAMVSSGAQAGGIEAVIGPCIGASSYEVAPDFYDTFGGHDEANARFFASSGAKENHFLFDLGAYVLSRLQQQKAVADVWRVNDDTYENADIYFSHRRSTHKKQPDTGRQISVISITG